MAEETKTVKDILAAKLEELGTYEDHKFPTTSATVDLTDQVNWLLGAIKNDPAAENTPLSESDLREFCKNARQRQYNASKKPEDAAKDSPQEKPGEERSAAEKYKDSLAFDPLDAGFTFNDRHQNVDDLITKAKAAHVPPPSELSPPDEIAPPAASEPAAPEPAASPAISDDDIKAVRNLQIEFADAKPGDKKFIGEGRQGVDRDDRTKLVQTQLAALGYDVGTIDGDYGPQTAAAIYKFQQENGLTADARAGAQTLDKLAEKLTEKQAGQKAEIAAATAETAATFPPPPPVAEAEKTGEITITPSKGMQIAELATKLGVDNDKRGDFLTAVQKAIGTERSQIAQGESVTLDGDSMGITPSEARAAAEQDVTVQKKGGGGRA